MNRSNDIIVQYEPYTGFVTRVVSIHYAGEFYDSEVYIVVDEDYFPAEVYFV